jgi:uncharacterized phage protein (TIGR01671 family)
LIFDKSGASIQIPTNKGQIMREIKFRAWHGESSEMVYFDNRKLTQDEYQRCHLAMLLAGDYGDVLMQFTGLQDKNGVDMYEGDIIAYGCFALNDAEKFGENPWENLPEGVHRDDITTIKSVHQVKFCIPSLMAIKQAIESNPDVYGVEIIGNIYENKELLDSTNKEG